MITKAVGLVGSSASWALSVASALSLSPSEELMQSLMKSIFALAMAIVGYFLKKTAESIEANRKDIAECSKKLGEHDIILSLWVEDISDQLQQRGESIGRRKTDHAMAELVTALRHIKTGES